MIPIAYHWSRVYPLKFTGAFPRVPHRCAVPGRAGAARGAGGASGGERARAGLPSQSLGGARPAGR